MTKKKKTLKHLQQFINLKSPIVLVNAEEDFTFVIPEDIVYIRSAGHRVKFFLIGGELVETREKISSIKDKFSHLSNFISGDEISLINTDFISSTTYEYGEYRAFFKPEAGLEYARITPGNSKKFKKYFKTNSLRFLKYYKRSLKVCQKFDIRNFDNNITEFDKEKLLTEFTDSKGNFMMTELLYNLIWQVYNQMINNELNDDDMLMGNIRSFWYTYYKPVLATLEMVDERYYSDMIEAFTKYTVDWKLFKYRDWDFLDIKRHNKQIGKGKRIYLIMAAEKEGHLRILEHIHRKHKITTIALGGESSVLSVEYFVDDLEDREIDKDREFHIFFFTDYDPSGFNIQKTFIQKLKRHGIKQVKTHQLMTLDQLTPKEIETNKFPLLTEDNQHSQTWKTIIKKWVRKTGGIGDGYSWKQRAFGMEADSIKPGRVVKIFEKMAKPYLK